MTMPLMRHRILLRLRDLTEEDPTEVEARQIQFEFCKVDGNVRLHGKRPAGLAGYYGHDQTQRW